MADHDPLTKELATFKRSVDARFATVNSTLKRIEPQVGEMHDYILVQKGIQESKNQGNININSEVWQLILKLIIIIAALLGVTKL